MLAIGVAVGMLVMVTLLPALLVIFPRGVFWPYRPTYGSAEPTTRGLWARVGWRIAPRPRLTWITTAVILGILALGLTGLKANGLTNAQSFRGHPDSVVGESRAYPAFPHERRHARRRHRQRRARPPRCGPPSPPPRASPA